MTTKYQTNQGLVESSISGGRLHHTFRFLSQALDTYPYITSFGDNFHTLSRAIFGSDTYWWILQDINKPKDAFSFKVGDNIKLPTAMVNNSIGTEKFFQ